MLEERAASAKIMVAISFEDQFSKVHEILSSTNVANVVVTPRLGSTRSRMMKNRGIDIFVTILY